MSHIIISGTPSGRSWRYWAEKKLKRARTRKSLLKHGERQAAVEQYDLAHARLAKVYGDDHPKVQRILEMRAEALRGP